MQLYFWWLGWRLTAKEGTLLAAMKDGITMWVCQVLVKFDAPDLDSFLITAQQLLVQVAWTWTILHVPEDLMPHTVWID